METDKDIKVGEYRGFSVSLTSFHTFEATAYGETRSSATWQGLCEEIDALAKAKAKARKLALSVVDKWGTTHTITGLNLGTGRFLGVPGYGTAVYVPTPAVLDAIAQIKRLNAELGQFTAVLQAACLKDIPAREISAETYDACLDRIAADYKAKMGDQS